MNLDDIRNKTVCRKEGGLCEKKNMLFVIFISFQNTLSVNEYIDYSKTWFKNMVI